MAWTVGSTKARTAALAPECEPATFTVTCTYLANGDFGLPPGGVSSST